MQNLRSNRSKIPFTEIIRLYSEDKLSTVKISKIAGISSVGVYRILKSRNVKIRTKAESEFLKRKYDYKSIIEDYKNGNFLCDIVKKYNIEAGHARRIIINSGIKSRGRESILSGDKHPFWKGGLTHDKDGYIVKNERGHQTKYHRYVLQMALGRKLLKMEISLIII